MKKTITINKWMTIVTILFLTACSDGDVAPIIEEPVTLDGKYTGGWTSTTATVSFSSFPISAQLFTTGDKTSLNGEFFATRNLTSCCNSGNNDGRITMTLDGDIITAFSLNVIIPGCSGNFTGSGVIKPSGDLVIDFTGTDCDGDHIGQLVFSK